MEIYTVGHSNHTWSEFAKLLDQHEIRVLVDTRTSPASKYAPFANEQSLRGLLTGHGITYVPMGDSLGGKPDDPSLYDAKGKPDYRRMRASPRFDMGIGDLLALAAESRVVLMCAEEDPSKCHRRLLIGPALLMHGAELRHIRADASLQGSDSLGNKRAYQSQFQGTLSMDVPNN